MAENDYVRERAATVREQLAKSLADHLNDEEIEGREGSEDVQAVAVDEAMYFIEHLLEENQGLFEKLNEVEEE